MTHDEQESPDRVPIRDLLAEEASLPAGQDPEWFLELHEALDSGGDSPDAARDELLERLEQDPDLKRRFEAYRRGVALLEKLGERERDSDGGSALRDRILASVAQEEASGLRGLGALLERRGAGLALLASGALAAAATLLFFLLLEDRAPDVGVFDKVTVHEGVETDDLVAEDLPAVEREEESLDGLETRTAGTGLGEGKKAKAPAEIAGGAGREPEPRQKPVAKNEEAERKDRDEDSVGRSLGRGAGSEFQAGEKSKTARAPRPEAPAGKDGVPRSEIPALAAVPDADRGKKKGQRFGDRTLKDPADAAGQTVTVYHLRLAKDLELGKELEGLSVAKLDVGLPGRQALLGLLDKARKPGSTVERLAGQVRLPVREQGAESEREETKEQEAGRGYKGRGKAKQPAGTEGAPKSLDGKRGLAARKRSGRLRERAKGRGEKADEKSVLAVQRESRTDRPSSEPFAQLPESGPVLLRVRGPDRKILDLLVRLQREGLASGTRGFRRVDLPRSAWHRLGQSRDKRGPDASGLARKVSKELLRRDPVGGRRGAHLEIYLLIERSVK